MDISSWRNKDLVELSAIEMAYAHLNNSSGYQLKDGYLTSVLPVILREIRHVRYQMYSQNYVPVVAAFGAIEQIGFSYSRTDIQEFPNANASSIIKALYYFADFSYESPDLTTIYALRNSFLHCASPVSQAQYNKKPNYHFIFDRQLDTLIKYPEIEWDGDMRTLAFDNATHINPEKVIDLATVIRDMAIDCLHNNNLRVNLEYGAEDIYKRFLRAD